MEKLVCKHPKCRHRNSNSQCEFKTFKDNSSVTIGFDGRCEGQSPPLAIGLGEISFGEMFVLIVPAVFLSVIIAAPLGLYKALPYMIPAFMIIIWIISLTHHQSKMGKLQERYDKKYHVKKLPEDFY